VADPITAFETPLFARLSGATAIIAYLGGTYIYNHVAHDTPPATGYIIFQHQVGMTSKTMGTNGGNDNESALYYIKGVVAGPENIERAAHIFSLIDAEVNGQVVDATSYGYRNFFLQREGVQKYPDNFGYWHCGGLYRVFLEKQ